MQLPMPTIPTDNLYKFMAIAGLVVFLVCLVYPTMMATQVTSKVAEIQASRTRLDTQMARLEKEVNSLSVDVNAAKTNPAEVIASDALEHRSDSNREKLDRSADLLVEFEKSAKIALAESQSIYAHLELLVVFKFYALAMMLLGFFLWYWRVQRFADTIIRAQAEGTLRDNAVLAKSSEGPSIGGSLPNPPIAPVHAGAQVSAPRKRLGG